MPAEPGLAKRTLAKRTPASSGRTGPAHPGLIGARPKPGALLAQELRRRRAGAGVLALVLAAFGALALTIADALGGLLADVTARFPEELSTFIGADAPGGYVVGEMFSLIFPITVVAFGIIVGAGALAGEERDGTMTILSAQPVSRIGVLWSKAVGVLLALTVVVALNWMVMALFIAAGTTDLTLTGLTGGTLHLLFLGLAFAAVAFAVAAATGHPGVASSATGAVAVVAYLAATMLPIAGFDGWARGSPWYFYLLNSDPLRNGSNLADLAIFGIIIAMALGFAVVLFRRRDLRG